MPTQPIYDHCSRAYLRIKQTPHGYTVQPADITAFETARGVGERLEPNLTAMPDSVSLTSIAISMARLADDHETLCRIAFSQMMRDNARKTPWWKRLKKKETEREELEG